MNTTIRAIAVVLAALSLAVGSVQAHGRHGGHRGGVHLHGYYGPGYGYWRPGLFWGGVGLAIGLGAAGYYRAAPWHPGYVVVPPPVGYYDEPRELGRAHMAKGPPDPVIHPHNGQSAGQTESDRQDCNRWATTQPSAMADAGVFHRTAITCMEGRGYSVR